MRARKCLCSATLGVLAISASVYAAPRGKDQSRPDSLRGLTGSDAVLRDVIDRTDVSAGCVTISVVPVAPPTGGGSYNFPATGGFGISGNTITLPGGVDQRVWFDVMISNWACIGSGMKTWQTQFSPVTASVTSPAQACVVATDCTAVGIGRNSDGSVAVGGGCGAPAPPLTCATVWEDNTRADALAYEIEACNPVALACGGTQALGAPVVDPGTVKYGMTAVFEVDSAFTGTTVLGLKGNGLDTFVQDANGATFGIGKILDAVIEVPLGSCCAFDPCTENTQRGACPGPDGLWREGVACPQNGGPACAECFVAGDCPQDQAGACTINTCESLLCVYTPTGGYVPGGSSCCNPANGSLLPRADNLACTDDSCSVNDTASIGTPVHDPSGAGTPCDDDNPCTYGDVCDGVSTTGCLGTNVNGEACVADVDCQHGGDTPGAVCEANGFCSCTLEPDLNFVIVPGDKPDPNCFDEGDKITVAIHVGPAASVINGGQFAIEYDPSCLHFQTASPGGGGPCLTAGQCIGGANNLLSCDDDADCPNGYCNCLRAGNPYTQQIQEIVGHVCVGGSRDGLSCSTGADCPGTGAQCVENGTLFYAVGVALGGVGVAGNVDMAILTFGKLGDCTQCVLCFTNVNPLHTYLVDDTGQPVNVSDKCSKEIHVNPIVELTGIPETVKVNVGCNSNTREVTWDAPVATTDCDGVRLVCEGQHLDSGCLAGHCCGGSNDGNECDDKGDCRVCVGGTRAGLPCTLNGSSQCPGGTCGIQGKCFPSATGGGVFPVGNTNFCCSAVSDKCGEGIERCWTVTVNDATALDVEIQLSPTMKTKPSGSLIRCIEFEVFSNCVQAPLTFCDDMVFGGLFNLIGHFNGNVKIPSQVQPECITARDKLHTLRSCYLFGDGDCDENGRLSATFKGDPFFGGNWLIGGNLDGWKKLNPKASHDVIDILDFGQIVAQWLVDYGTGDTPCDPDCHPDDPNADINGDGIVDLLDYSFVSMNFLENSKDCCCPGSASLGNTVGRTEISVNELIRNNLKDLTVADLNNDGLVNQLDMQALLQGVRPARQAPDRESDKGSTGSRSINR